MTTDPTGVSPVIVPPGPSELRRRPFGLAAIIVIQVLTVLLSGSLLMLMGLVLALATGVIPLEGLDPDAIQLDFSLPAIASLVLTLVVNAICAVGLWRRQRWAWFFTMLQLGFFMFGDLLDYFAGSPPANYVWSMLLNVGMVFYLNQREVQAVFLAKEEQT